MPDQPGIQKGYESIPAYELIKYYVVSRIVAISELAAKTQLMKFLGKDDPLTEYQFRSDVLNFYQILRPKMLDYAARHAGSIQNLYKVFIAEMDYFCMHFTMFETRDAITAFSNINQFCEDYKLTSTTMWTGIGHKIDNAAKDLFNA